MRLVSYRDGTQWRAGVLVPDVVVPAGAVSVRELLESGPETLATLAERTRAGDGALALDGLELGPPVPDPDKIICVGHNYEAHVREASRAVPSDAPVLFAKYRTSLIGHRGVIHPPRTTAKVDYEGELAAVIGRICHDVAEKEALTYVAGYMPFNDVSARDLQRATTQVMLGKAIDSFAPCGPALVLADEVGDPQALALRTRVNGETLQRSSTALMMRSVAELISFISRTITLVPGDIVATGTPEGVGAARSPQRFLREGDVVEVEIGGLGTLSNTVGPWLT